MFRTVYLLSALLEWTYDVTEWKAWGQWRVRLFLNKNLSYALAHTGAGTQRRHLVSSLEVLQKRLTSQPNVRSTGKKRDDRVTGWVCLVRGSDIAAHLVNPCWWIHSTRMNP